MGHVIAARKPLLARIRRIKGQADAIERALEADGDCAALLQQIAAIRGAVNGLMAEVLEGHIREHLVGPGRAEAALEGDVDAVVGALRSYLK